MKKYWVVIAAFVTVCIAICWIATDAGTASTAATQPVVAPMAAPSYSATDAAKQFKDLMDLSEKGNLVSSYTFSDTERVIYVTDVWYSMNVQFKKDFLAKVAMLQDAMSGKHFFEVRNDYSNEIVGEVTAFSGSLEVYKKTLLFERNRRSMRPVKGTSRMRSRRAQHALDRPTRRFGDG